MSSMPTSERAACVYMHAALYSNNDSRAQCEEARARRREALVKQRGFNVQSRHSYLKRACPQ